MERRRHFSKQLPTQMRAVFFLLTLISSAVASESDEWILLARSLRQQAIAKVSGSVIMTAGRPDPHAVSFSLLTSGCPLHTNISTTVFWVGELPSPGDPGNLQSAWDPQWISTATSQTPFYAALPYNDIDGEHHTKAEAARVIPWFKSAFVENGRSVCRGRWIEIRHRGRVCYARWEDVGPFQTDHWQYVFGYERPRPNRNNDAGLDVSPAVREYLGLNGLDVCDWRFVTSAPPGPWSSSVRPSIVNAFHGPKL